MKRKVYTNNNNNNKRNEMKKKKKETGISSIEAHPKTARLAGKFSLVKQLS